MFFGRFNYGHTYTSMKLFSFFDNVLNQRTSESIHGKSISIICLFIETKLSPLQKVENYAILLSNQTTPYTLKGIYFSLINPIFPWQSEKQQELTIDKSKNTIRSWVQKPLTYVSRPLNPNVRYQQNLNTNTTTYFFSFPFPLKPPSPSLFSETAHAS